MRDASRPANPIAHFAFHQTSTKCCKSST